MLKHLQKGLFFLLIWVSAASAQVPGQPFSSYWFPATSNANSVSIGHGTSLLAWNPANDPDAPYNVSAVPLAARFTASNVNTAARLDGAKVVSLVSLHGTQNSPSQGGQSFVYYTPNYWQYNDFLVYWGGSSGEGLILAPNPTIVDAAHRNGIPVLGNIFFPPTVYGGSISQVTDLLQKNGSTFPVADKLIQAAQYYKFDGWFINQETEGGNAAIAGLMQEFINYIHAQAPDMHIQWYDAMSSSGAVNWQGALNSNNQMYFENSGQTGNVGRVADSMFVDFRWSGSSLTSSRTLANTLGRSPYSLFAGIDVQGDGYDTTVNWTGLFPTGSTQKMSLGLYRPDETYNHATGSNNLALVRDFYSRDNKFWVGANRDPSDTAAYVSGSGTTGWHGIAHYIPAKSPAMTLPFVTSFNTGQGNKYAINGQILATGGWNNLSLQDILPTWRWLISSTGTKLYPDLVWDDAYYGGTSLKVSGDMTDVNDLKLYEVRLPVATNTNLRIAFKTGKANAPSLLKVAVSYTNAPGTFTYLEAGITTTSGWNTALFSLGDSPGKVLHTIGLRLGDGSATNGYAIYIGQLAVFNGEISTPAPPTGITLDGVKVVDASTYSMRLRWTHSTSPVYYYNLYQRLPDNSRVWLGATPNNAYFVPDVGAPLPAIIEIETVAPDFGVSTTASWSDSPLLYWQGNVGTWDTNTIRWAVTAAGPANRSWDNTQNYNPFFGGPGGSVTTGVAVVSSGLNVQSDGWSIHGTHAITLAGSFSPVLNVTNGSVVIYAPLVGSQDVVKTGPGSLVLSGSNNLTGNLSITAGTVAIGATKSLNGLSSISFDTGLDCALYGLSNGLVVNQPITGNTPANFRVDAGNTLTLSGVVAGASQFRKQGEGTVILAALNTHTGKTVINAGTLQLATGARDSLSANLDVLSGTFDLNGNSAAYSSTVTLGTASSNATIVSGPGILSAGGLFAVKSGSIPANLSGAAGLTKTTAGTVVLSGTNSYSGPTLVVGGVLKISGTQLSTGSVSVSSGATLEITRGRVNASSLINNGTMRLTGGASITVSGSFTNNGILDMMTGAAQTSDNLVNNGRLLDRRHISITSFEQGSTDFQLNIGGYSGHGYQLQRADSLTGPWTDIGTAQSGATQADGSPGVLTLTDPDLTVASNRFYRVLVQP